VAREFAHVPAPSAGRFAKLWLNFSSLKFAAAMLELDDRDGEGEPRISQDQRSYASHIKGQISRHLA
jgi:hypothetical protein